MIELRDPVALARLVEQRMRKGGAKTEKWRLRAGISRDVNKDEEERGRDDCCVVPSGTVAVALKEPVPLASFSDVASSRSGTDVLKRKGKGRGVRVVARR